MNIALVGLLALIGITYVSSLNWQRAVQVALVIAVLEGALRKWALPQASQLIYFFKDFILLGAYLRFFSLPKEYRPFLKHNDILISLLGLAAVWCGIQALNPSLGSVVIGIFGFKNYFFYVPLLWLLPSLFTSEKELIQFLRIYLLLLIPVGCLAIAQFFSPPDSPLNVYAWDEGGPDVAVGGNSKVRVTGTFSYLAGYSTYLGFCLTLILPTLSLKQHPLWQWITTAEVLLITITAFMTGSRTLIFASVLLIAGYFGIQGIGSLKNLFHTLQKFLVPGLLGFYLVTTKFREGFDGFWVRVTSNNDASARVNNSFLEPFDFFRLTGLGGYGAGATFQANGAIRAVLRLSPGDPIPVGYEGELGRVALEIGPIGFFAWYGLKLLLLFLLWNTYASLRRPFLRQLALSIFLYQSITFTAQIVFNHTANLYYWFLNGFILLLPQIEYLENWRASQQQWYYYGSSPHLPDSSHQ